MEFTLTVNELAKETTQEIECDIDELQQTINGISELQALLTNLKTI